MFVCAAVTLGLLGLSAAVASPATAAPGSIGYVRLAHLSPDTPNVDVYLDSLSRKAPRQVFPGVGYGTVSQYLSLPAGTYSVSMRASGADPKTPPILTTDVTVHAGRAYTVAGVGTHADLGLRVIDDDLSLPGRGEAKIRVVQGSVKAPVLNVSIDGGQTLASNVAFATTTKYHDVTPGTWTLDIRPPGGSPTPLRVTLGAGNVYSLLVLDGKAKLTIELRTDASRHGAVPIGGVETGLGGTRSHGIGMLPIAGGAVALLIIVAATGLFLRRRRTHSRVL